MKLIQLLALSASLALAACSKNATTDKPADAAGATAPAAAPVFSVNGKAISQEFFETYTKAVVSGKTLGELTDDERDAVKENLARFELIAQQAEKDGMLKDPALATRIELARLNLIQQAVAEKYFKDHEPGEAELRAEYETQIAAAPLVEWHARHILVTTEDVAQKIIGRLKGGANFADLAKSMSKDTNSARQGGDLGWFGPHSVDPAFAEGVALLNKGEVTPAPVQTRLGWHVVQLLDTRDAQPKPFDDVKAQVARLVVGKKYKAWSDEMLRTAKIDPPLKSQPAAPAPAAPANAGAAAPKTN